MKKMVSIASFMVAVTGLVFIGVMNSSTLEAQTKTPRQQGNLQTPVDNVQYTIENNIDHPGKDYNRFEIPENKSCAACEEACSKDPKCKGFTYVKPGYQGKNAWCWLKSELSKPVPNKNCITGVKMQFVPIMVPDVKKKKVYSKVGWNEDEPKIKANIDIPGNDIRQFPLGFEDPTPFRCQRACKDDTNCTSWTFVLPGVQSKEAQCWLKKGVPTIINKNENCISGVKLEPIVKNEVRGPSEKIITQEERQQLMTKFDNSWRGIVRAKMGPDINLTIKEAEKEILQLQKNMIEHYARQFENPSNSPVMAPNMSKPLIAFSKIPYSTPDTFLVKPDIYKLKHVDESTVYKPTVIDRVVALSTSGNPNTKPNHVVEGQYIIIYGQNFGYCLDGECDLKIELVTKSEITKESDEIRTKQDLLPYRENWIKSWNNDFIVAQIPVIKDSYKVAGKSLLTVWKKGWSFVLKYEVYLEQVGPSIAYVMQAPSYVEGHISPGAEVTIYGSGFGARGDKSKVEIILTSRYGLPVIPLAVTNWDDKKIKAKVPIPLTEILKPKDIEESVELKVFDNMGKESMIKQHFGPRMTLTAISGLDFIWLVQGEREDNVVEKPNSSAEGNMMVVTHYPGCGWSGEDGNDNIFETWPLPKNVTVVGYTFYAMNPEDAVDNFGYVIDNFLKLLANPYLYAGEMVLCGIISAFCPGFGAFKTEMRKEPTEYAPGMEIHWENTCWMRYSGIPNIYTTSFILRGPEGWKPLIKKP